MHMTSSTITVIVAFASAVYLLLQSSNRMFPTIASVASGVELLLAMGVMSLSVAKFRIDVILPALLVIAGIACWGKSSTKGAITAATAVGLIGLMQLLLALHLFS